MANSNLAVMTNNMIASATEPTLPDESLVDAVMGTNKYVTCVFVDSMEDFMPKYTEKCGVMSRYEYIGELNFYNEAIGLLEYIHKCRSCMSYDMRSVDESTKLAEYYSSTVFFGMPRGPVDVVIDATDLNVYRVITR